MDLGGSGTSVSPVVSLVAWDKGGSDSWGAGIPAPTIDCAAVGTSSSASLQCSGANPSFAGPGQVAAGSPWWYRGDAGVRPAIALNGSTDYWSLGDTADPAGSLVICFSGSLGANVAGIVTKDNGAQRSWGVTADASGNLSLTVFKSGGGNSTKTFGTLSPGNNGTACVAYAYVSDGSSIIRGNVNGTASTDLTNAVGPIVDTAALLRVGYDFAARYLAGGVRRVAIWTGADAPTSAAQLAQLVATQNGLAHDKPAGTVASCSRSDSTYCGPFSDAEQFLLGPGFCCIHAPSYQGWASGGAVAGGIEVYGAGANALAASDVASGSWANYNASVTAVDAYPFVDGTMTMDEVTTAANGLRYIVYSLGSSTGPFTFSGWVRSPSGTSTASILGTCGNGGTIAATNYSCHRSDGATCTVGVAGGSGYTTYAYTSVGTTPVRFWLTWSCATGITITQPGVTGGQYPTTTGSAVWGGAQLTPTAYPVPYRATTGTAYAGIASTATTLTVPVPATVTDARGAVYAQWITSATTTNARILGFSGSATPAAILSATGLQSWDGTNLLSLASSWTAGAPSWIRADWGAIKSLATAAASASGAYDGAWLGSVIYVGSNAGTGEHLNGLVSRVVQCKRAGGCR